MTPDEISAILARLDRNDQDHDKIYRMLYLIIGIALGSGALTLSQVVGI